MPNIILVITDDQGYGDLGCTGNPWIRTPHLDRFHSEALRCTDFHVHPLCTPSRGALMTGQRPMRNGAWATGWGRSILRRDIRTLPQALQAHGYRTGLFGKWHLGDNYPYRPQDRGFETVVAHKGGGVGQSPDFWGNNYFDDTYFHNSRPVAMQGYCTDIWFEQAAQFIAQEQEKPFFACIATNAPHSPYLVPEHYSRPYRDNPAIPEPEFYGMISNIDENFGRLRTQLADRDIEQDTLLIFMTDNGTSGGCRLTEEEYVNAGYNAGMRGKKGSYYEGGHRVPFFIRWPKGGLGGGADCPVMALDIDLFPTLLDLCGIPMMEDAEPDGLSIATALRGNIPEAINDRVHCIQFSRGSKPPPKGQGAVLTRRWRLVRERELYDIQTDPGQRRDVAVAHPDVVRNLQTAYDDWWKSVTPETEKFCPIILGNAAENPTRLEAMDVMGDMVWHQRAIITAEHCSGVWNVMFDCPGRYRFGLRRWPRELGRALEATLTPEEVAATAPYRSVQTATPLVVYKAVLTVFDQTAATPVAPGEEEAGFDIHVPRAGQTTLYAHFEGPAGRQGAYYVYVERQS